MNWLVWVAVLSTKQIDLNAMPCLTYFRELPKSSDHHARACRLEDRASARTQSRIQSCSHNICHRLHEQRACESGVADGRFDYEASFEALHHSSLEDRGYRLNAIIDGNRCVDFHMAVFSGKQISHAVIVCLDTASECGRASCACRVCDGSVAWPSLDVVDDRLVSQDAG